MTRTVLILFLGTFLIGCNTELRQKKDSDQLLESISGDWERVFERDKPSDDTPPQLYYGIPEGMTIAKDSIEFYEGFTKDVWDSTGNRTRLNLLEFPDFFGSS